MKKLLIAAILLAFIISSTAPGYCYSNVIASRTTDDTSPYENTLQVGLEPGEEATIAGSSIVVSGIIAGTGMYFVLNCPSYLQNNKYLISPELNRQIAREIYKDPEFSKSGIIFKESEKWIKLEADTVLPFEPYNINIAKSLSYSGVACIVVMVVTAAGVYVWWSSS